MKKETSDMTTLTITIIGLVVIGLILMVFVRIQRGLLGFILAGLAVALLTYWLKEIRKTIKKELLPSAPSNKPEWNYDLIENDDELTVVAEVPGPEDHIKVKLTGRTLEIKSRDFQKMIRLPKDSRILTTSYLNGVLNIKLRKQPNLWKEEQPI